MSRTKIYKPLDSTPKLIKTGRIFGIVLDIPGEPVRIKNEHLLRKEEAFYEDFFYYIYAFPEEPNKWYHRYYKQGQ